MQDFVFQHRTAENSQAQRNPSFTEEFRNPSVLVVGMQRGAPPLHYALNINSETISRDKRVEQS